MSFSVIIAHDPARSPELLNRALLSINHELLAMNVHGESEVFVEIEGSVSEARNKAAAQAQGEFLVFLDDDVILRAHFFQEIIEPFSDPGVGIVGGVNLNFDDVSFREKISSVLFASPFIMAKSAARYTPRGSVRETDESEIIACVMAVRKTAFQEAGGFPLDVIPCEENVLINRIQAAGWKVIYSPFAIVYHKRPAFPGEYARKIFFYGKGRGIMLRHNRLRGSPKMFWKLSWRWPIYVAGFFLHYAAYVSGLIYGYFKGKKKP